MQSNVGPLPSQHEQGGYDPVTPILHASRHAQGGADALTAEDIGAARLVGGVIDAEQSVLAIHQQTASYAATPADNGSDIWITSATDATLTIPTQQNAAFAEKTSVLKKRRLPPPNVIARLRCIAVF